MDADTPASLTCTVMVFWESLGPWDREIFNSLLQHYTDDILRNLRKLNV